MGKVTVFGSFNVDLVSYTPHHPKPGESVVGGPFRVCPGGKGSNQAVAAKKAGADVILITKVGDDEFKDIAYKNFSNNDMNTDYIFEDKDHATGVALIEIETGTGENTIVVAVGANNHVTEVELLQAKHVIQKADVFLTQYEMNLDAVLLALKMAKEGGVTTIVNPAPAKEAPHEIYNYIDIFTPNETEAEALSGIDVSKQGGIEEAAVYFTNKGVKTTIITLGSKGVYVYSDEFKGIVPAIKIEKAVDTVGAGDAFNGGLACGLSEGMNLQEAIKFGCIVAGLSVTREGAAESMPTRAEIEQKINSLNF